MGKKCASGDMMWSQGYWWQTLICWLRWKIADSVGLVQTHVFRNSVILDGFGCSRDRSLPTGPSEWGMDILFIGCFFGTVGCQGLTMDPYCSHV